MTRPVLARNVEVAVGELHHPPTQTCHCLRAEHIVGRAHAADLRIDDPVVSGLHAAIQWHAGRWSVRDLGSRNGVFVNGTRITAPTPLREGDTVGFGGTTPWVVTSDQPPRAFAVSLHDGREVVGTAATLGLPDAAAEHTSVSRAPTGWVAESDVQDGVIVEDRQVVEARGRWRLHLPMPGAHTTAVASLVHLDEADLCFVVSPDLEHIEIEVVHPAGPLRVPHFAANELLLVLALARRDDAATSPAEHGWIPFDQLISSFRLTPMSPRDRNRIRQWIHKCRRRFVDLGITDGERIVERRPGTRHVRLGTSRIEIIRRAP